MKQTNSLSMEVKLSMLWIFLMFNYLYCDVVGLMDPTLLKQLMTGTIGSLKITQEFLLQASILMEIPIAMVLLSRVLNYKANRWANIIAGIIMTAVQIASMFMGTPPTTYYVFFSIIEISTTVIVTWNAWKWTKMEIV